MNDEQFEDLVHGRGPEPEHLRDCDACQARLAEHRALAGRLQRAFHSVQAGADLRSRIVAATQAPTATPSQPHRLRVRRRLGPVLAAAAVIVLVALPLTLFRHTTSQVQASQLALSGIHHQVLDHPDTLFHDEDPNRMADHLEDLSGRRPTLIEPCERWIICGSRTCTFKGRTVPTYMVESASGRVSVVILPDTPAELGMELDAQRGFWIATCKCCRMAAVRMGAETYYALGDVPYEVLGEVLVRLAP